MDLSLYKQAQREYREQKRLEAFVNVRPLVRPNVKKVHIVLLAVLMAALIAGIITGPLFLPVPAYVKAIIIIVAMIAFIETYVRFMGIMAVKCYQRYATEDTRRRCKCIPSCSQYAILCFKRIFPLVYALHKIRYRLYHVCKGEEYLVISREKEKMTCDFDFVTCPACGTGGFEYVSGTQFICKNCGEGTDVNDIHLTKSRCSELHAFFIDRAAEVRGEVGVVSKKMNAAIKKRNNSVLDGLSWILAALLIVAGIGLYMFFKPLLIILPVLGVSSFFAIRKVHSVIYDKYSPVVAGLAAELSAKEKEYGEVVSFIAKLDTASRDE